MSEAVRSVQVFAGTVDSASPQFRGLHAPATLTLIERDAEYECKFVFFVGGSLPITLRVAQDQWLGSSWRGPDPRGWDVSFKAELRGTRVTGTFVQPHDRGTFLLDAV